MYACVYIYMYIYIYIYKSDTSVRRAPRRWPRT